MASQLFAATFVAILLAWPMVMIVRRRKRQVGVALGRLQESASKQVTEVLAVEAVVRNRLWVRVFSHVIETGEGAVPCWTFMSDGLLAEGQLEIAFTIKHQTGESVDGFLPDILDCYRATYALAAEKRLVHEGGASRFGQTRPGGILEGRGILYTPGQRLTGVRAPRPFLTALLLSIPELDMAEQYGHVRLMSLLCDRYRFFPTAPWLDPGRAELARPETVLASLRRFHIQGGYVRKEVRDDNVAAGQVAEFKVVLTLKRGAGSLIAERLKEAGPDGAMAILVNLDPTADTLLLWRPDNSDVSALGSPGSTGSRVAGNFFSVAAINSDAPDLDEGVRILEDGFVLTLGRSKRSGFCEALENDGLFEVKGSADWMDFNLAWVEESFVNPVDGKTYFGEWHKYVPRKPAAAPPDAIVVRGNTRLLQAQAEYEGLEAEAWAAYLTKADEAIAAIMSAQEDGTGFDLMVQFELTSPAVSRIQLACRPPSTLQYMRTLSDRLESIPAPPINGGPVSVLCSYLIRGGSGEQVP